MHDNEKIREEAGVTCVEIVVPAIKHEWQGLVAPPRVDPIVVTKVLADLLTNAISDRKSDVRRGRAVSLASPGQVPRES